MSLVTRCIETIDVCIWRIFVFMSVILTVWGSVRIFVVQRPLSKIIFCLVVLKHLVCLCKGCDGCCAFYFYCEAQSVSSS